MLDMHVPFPASALFFLAGYIVLGLGLCRLAKAADCPYPLLAWIPFGRLYLLGQVADLYTDNRITPAAIRFHTSFRPSDLRRRLLGLGIWYAALSAVATVGKGMKLAAKAVSFFSFLRSLLDSFSEGSVSLGDTVESSLEASPAMQRLSTAGTLLHIIAGIAGLILAVLFLTVLCPVLYRLFKALSVPVPALLTAISVVTPLLAAILIFAYTRHAEGLAERFIRPAQDGHTPSRT